MLSSSFAPRPCEVYINGDGFDNDFNSRWFAGKLELSGKRGVVVCTGHGLKDPGIITQQMKAPVVIPARVDALEKTLSGDK